MIGLGVLNNQPVNSYQPVLTDGIHLRWGFLRDLGFPWHGFYLYRRPTKAGQPLCLSKVTGGLKKGDWPENQYYTALGRLSSETNLVLTDEFAPANQVEFELDGRHHLRFDLPPGEFARRVELRIGFRALTCLNFGELFNLPVAASQIQPTSPGVSRPNPLAVKDVTFEVKGADGLPAANTQIDWVKTPSDPLAGLSCGYGLTINLPSPLNSVELLITRTLPPADLPQNVFTALNSDGHVVAEMKFVSLAGEPEIVKLNGRNITRVEVVAERNATYLHRVCFDSGEAVVKGKAFSGATVVRNFVIDSNAGQIAFTIIEAEAITAIEIGPCAGSLVDLCYVPVAQDATQGWEPLRDFSYPMGLPVSQPDYPCSVANPQSLLTDRVRYQLPAGWNGSTFTELHDQLVELVKGGPSAAPMVDRIFSAPPAVSNPPDLNPPKLSTFYILDMVLLGALHPALAQLVGLYWVDQTADPSVAYDYLIVADHTGVGQHDAAEVLTTIRSSGFAQLDGYVVFNKRKSTRSLLPAPEGLQTYELPGGTFPNAQGQLPQSSNNAGLRWDVGWDDSDALLRDHPVMYLVWRADLGNASTPGAVGSYDLITKIPPEKPKPILVTEPRLPNGVQPQRSPDWPPVSLHFIDRNLPDGWYSFEVSGIDLFGRHSLNSAPSQLLLRDKIPPPMPTAVEAYALDPEDRFLQRDEAYENWYNQLDSSAQQTVVGLRVRWRWTERHQQQAPDTSEFRIYFHPGADLPPDHDQAIKWQDRYYVVGYNDNVTVDSLTGERAYEIFLPPPTTLNPISIPLNPSLAEAVVYAHIGVSAADDKTHTNDQRTTGNWSNLTGNEGRVGPPSKIYRVLRTPPPPPEDIFAGERFYASPADYHGRSFFTYRWKPQPHLQLHVFRAMDDAVFKADYAQRPLAAPLDESQLGLFPAGWNQATRQAVVSELYFLNSFIGLADGTEQAMTYYRQLSDGALRVLAGLPSSERAFVQLTIKPLDPNYTGNPLDPNDAGNANRLGPDNPDDLVLDMNQRAFIDTLDGRSTNHYFYRSAFVDGAHNLGPLGLSSPPVYLPKMLPPNRPVLTKIRGGEKQIELRWVRSREPDLSAYRVYRTSDAANTRDLRKMDRVQELLAANIDLNQSEVSWIDTTAQAGIDFHYCVTALDSESLPNESAPSKVVVGRAVDTAPPQIPEWVSAEWVMYDATTESMKPWHESEVIPSSYEAAIRLELKTKADFCTIYRRVNDEKTWQVVAMPARQISARKLVFDLGVTRRQKVSYRALASNHLGVTSSYSPVMVVEPKEFSNLEI